MKTITSKITASFMEGKSKSLSNTKTDGKSLWLFNNKIAEHKDDGLYITNCGWFSRTTKERLNGLTDVDISQSKGKWYLNGKEWDGDWIKVNSNNPPIVDESKIGVMFDKSLKYISTDGWRGYYEPIYAVCGANDTGNCYDSPCPSDISEKEIKQAVDILKSNSIPVKIMTTETSNIFCVHHYVIVPPKHYEMALEVMSSNYNKNETTLLYLCK
jgi:hypothetical protein